MMSEVIDGTATAPAVTTTQDNADPTGKETVVNPTDPQQTDNDGGGGDGGTARIVKEGLLNNTDPGSKEDPAQEGGEPKKEEIEYGDFKIAEGLVIDEEMLGFAKKQFKELGLSQEQGQKLVDLQNTLVQKQGAQTLKVVEQETQKLINKWEDSVKADDELGGAGMAEKMAIARSAATKLECEDALTVISEANLGSNPAILRLLYRAGVALGEGKYVQGRHSMSEDKKLTDILYDKSNMK